MSEEIKGPTAEQVTEARDIGWQPKDSFRGDPTKWVDADVYLERGQEVLPLVKASNRKLTDQLSRTQGELQETKALLTNALDSIEALKEFNSQATRREAKDSRDALVVELKKARENNDVEAEVDISQRITDLNGAIKEAEEVKPKTKVEESKPTDDPVFTREFKEWGQANPWWGTDERKTALAVATGQWMRRHSDYKDLTGRPFLDAVAKEVEGLTGKSNGTDRESTDRVEGTRGGGNSSTTGKSKSYIDLPADAKSTCDRQESRMVGKGRAFQTQADWRKHYVNHFFA